MAKYKSEWDELDFEYDEKPRNKRTGLKVAALLVTLVVALVAIGLIFLMPGSSKKKDNSSNASNEIVNGDDNQEEDNNIETDENTDSGEDADSESNEWYLTLVNRDNPLPEDYKIPELTQLRNDNAIDSRVYPYLQQMFDDARKDGINIMITSSYRTREEQQQIMDDKIREFENQGMSHEDAEEEAKQWVAVPGTSEHELGLCVDISSGDKNTQNPTIIWDWLHKNASKYGFVQRYPEDKTDITGISNEPWHYRYVGKEAAQEMVDGNLCLEEYLEHK